MAIVTISQIKHRRGIKGVDPMPQLASAELGWAVDEQGLYIGNGTISEGAPALGNTEILTEHSNIASLLSDYTYAGPFSSPVPAIMNTDSGSGPVIRSENDHEDDRVNVRSFGAVGAGGASDLAALQQAIYQHTSDAPVSNRYWTTIYLPAGTYNIDGPLHLPSRVRLVGDGYNSTIINLTSSDASVISFGDVAGPDVTPTDIYISGIGFTVTQIVSHVCIIIDANNIIFDRVAFNGASANTTALGEQKASVLFSNVNLPTFAIKFLNCLFTGSTYGIITNTGGGDLRQDISDVIVENCIFDDLYKAISIGLEVDTGSFTFPSNWRVSVSLFDNITKEGIHCYQTSKFTSSMNHFKDVGNDQLGATNQTVSNIVLGDSGGVDPTNPGPVTIADYENNYSIGDTFDRDDTDDLDVQRITTNCYNSYVIDPSSIRHGVFIVEPGRLIRLANSSSGATGIALDSTLYHGAIIDYQLNRGSDDRRTGTLTLALGTADNIHSLTEDYIEASTPIGVVFDLDGTTGAIATINHVTDGSGNDAIFSYSIRHLTCILVTP